MIERKPIIAMNIDVQSSKAGDLYMHAAGYARAVTKAGGIPMILPPCIGWEELDATLDMVDGVLMIGGPDMDPRKDGYRVDPAMRLAHQERDTFDRMLAGCVVEKRKPVFAIGAGMQMLNVTLGGMMLYHLPIDNPKGQLHLDPLDANMRHVLTLEPNSRMGDVYGFDSPCCVISSHHMAVDPTYYGRGLRVTARTSDGMVEAMEGTDPSWFILAVQFHPECGTAMDFLLFERFLDAVKNTMVFGVDLAVA